jgi:hypothetical protein
MSRIKALTLYKSILRAHSKYLPMEMRQLGDAYVKSEVRFCDIIPPTFRHASDQMILILSMQTIVSTSQINNQARTAAKILHRMG